MAMVNTALGSDVENSELIEQYKAIQNIKEMKGIQARMPFEVKVDWPLEWTDSKTLVSVDTGVFYEQAVNRTIRDWQTLK